MYSLPNFKFVKRIFSNKLGNSQNLFSKLKTKKGRYGLAIILDVACITLILLNAAAPAQRLMSPIFETLKPLQPLTETEVKDGYEVMGFAPHWTFNRLDNVDFDVLTTFAYFGLDVDGEGNLVKSGPGYETFQSDKATEVFKKAHSHGTRVVLTVTQMKNPEIRALMDNPEGQQKVIRDSVALVKERGIDGINIDIEYTGNPGKEYRDKFSKFVADWSAHMHAEVPSSKVTVSVYASAVKEPKIYDIAEISKSADGIFMMAYDFAVASSDNAIPTAPLYGHKEGKYWYDVATAVDDFLKFMPAEKLILGVPYYGYNYMVYEPEVKATTRPNSSWRGVSRAQTYKIVQEDVPNEVTGWDDYGKVSYKAYYDENAGTWRMVFYDDPKSLAIKYDFAKDRKLAGVGMWALGFDSGKTELWDLLAEKFGSKLADSSVLDKRINDIQ